MQQPTSPVLESDLQLSVTQSLVDSMIVTMRKADGIGLAAPQVGQNVRIAVIDDSADSGLKEPLVLLNPTILERSVDHDIQEEGCLSIPGVFGYVPRPTIITVQAYNRQAQLLTLSAEGLLARVIQHEVDHLDGVLFITRATSFTKGKNLLP